jgi:hypothetical protein
MMHILACKVKKKTAIIMTKNIWYHFTKFGSPGFAYPWTNSIMEMLQGSYTE